jgi:hypothetical protein
MAAGHAWAVLVISAFNLALNAFRLRAVQHSGKIKLSTIDD